MNTSPWTDLGMGLGGTGGLTPALVGSGELLGDTQAMLSLSNCLPGADVYLVAGFSELSAPF